MSAPVATILRAVIPPAILRRWDAIALRQLCEALVREAEEVARLRSDVRCADDLADFWREQAMELQQQLAEATGRGCGITMAGELVLTPPTADQEVTDQQTA